MIIHITGPSLSGKTTIAKRLKSEYGDNIIIIDIQMTIAKRKVKNTYNIATFQRYLNMLVTRNKSCNIIFIGDNEDPDTHKEISLCVNHKLFIDIGLYENATDIFKAEYTNDINMIFYAPVGWVDDKDLDKITPDMAIDVICKEWVTNTTKHNNRIKTLIDEISPNKIVQDIKHIRSKYKKRDYLFMSRDKTYEYVNELLMYQTF